MEKAPAFRNPLDRLLSDRRIRSTVVDGRILYDVVGLLDVLGGSQFPEELWHDLKQREPVLARLAEAVELPNEPNMPRRTVEALDLPGVLRLIQSVQSPKAESLKRWLIESARQRIDEAHNPELAFLRAQKLYRRRGYDRRWIDKRLRSASTRQDLVSEWYRRGATDSEHFRELTNRLMQESFGMDVETYRRYKGLSRATEKLRDHMTDLELALVALAETAATSLSRDRNSSSLEQLQADVTDAGRIVARTRNEIERAGGRAIIDRSRASRVARPAQAA